MKEEKTTAERISRKRKDDVVETGGLVLSTAHNNDPNVLESPSSTS
ncbi:hypothetical protein I6N93_07140 [Lonsdalea populi]|nr:hypothetical protein I6N93_07140 [Lonsdalea populi]